MKGLIFLVLVTQSLAQISLNPAVFTAILHGAGRFTCSGSALATTDRVIDIQWQLNNTPLEKLGLDSVEDTFFPQSSIGLLIFSNVSQDLNMTNVTCLATLTSGHVVISVMTSTLLVQGLLSAVGLLNITASNTTLSLIWEPPFTLDITEVLDDITCYCVDVINSTSSVTLHSECDIIETTFTYPIPPDANCHVYNFTVTPVNKVGNGTEDTASYIGVQTSPEVLSLLRDSDDFITSMSTPVCDVKLTLLDLNTGENISIGANDLTLTDDNITFPAAQLTTNRHYNVSVSASNAAGTSTSVHQISTHDIEVADIDFSAVSITYFTGSNARGALLSQVCITDTSSTPTFQTLHRSDQRPIPYNLMALTCSGQVQIFLYDIEGSGTLSRGRNYPAVMQRVAADKQGSDVLAPIPFHLRNCSVETFPSFIRAKCAYPGGSGAVVTGFQVIVQPAEFDRHGKLYANHTSDGKTSGSLTVEVEQNGEFLVSIIPVLGGTGIVNSSIEYTELVVVNKATDISPPSPSNEKSHVIIIVCVVAVIIITCTIFLLMVLICVNRGICCFKQKHVSAHDDNKYVVAPLDYSTTKEPDGERGVTPDPEQQQQLEQVVVQDTVQLPQEDEKAGGEVYSGVSPHGQELVEAMNVPEAASAC